jgi:hypothetical protein
MGRESWWVGGYVALCVIAGFVGLAFCGVVNDQYPRAAAYGAPVALAGGAVLTALLKALRERDLRPARTGELVGSFVGLAGVGVFLGLGSILIANAAVDRSPVETHRVAVQSTYFPRDDGSPHFTVASWRGAGAQLIGSAPSWDEAFIRGLKRGDVVRVDTRAGALGLERLVGVGRAER